MIVRAGRPRAHYPHSVELVLLAIVAFLVGFDAFTRRPRTEERRDRLSVDLRRR